jgi:excisionase family DNA binding protein
MDTPPHGACRVSPTASHQYLSPRHVAEQYGIHCSTVYRRIKKGDLAAYRIGRYIRLDADEVSAVFQSVSSNAAYELPPEVLAHAQALAEAAQLPDDHTVRRLARLLSGERS